MSKEPIKKVPFNKIESVSGLELFSFAQRTKFEYTFAALIFGTFALSFKVTPKSWDHFPLILIISWILYFISVMCAGKRIYNWIWHERYRVREIISDHSNESKENIQEIHTAAGTKLEKMRKYFPVQIYFYIAALFNNGLWATFNFLFETSAINYHNPVYGCATFCVSFTSILIAVIAIVIGIKRKMH